MNARLPLILILIFILVTGGAYGLQQAYPAYDFTALMVANGIMLALSLAAWAMLRKTVTDRPQAFVRGVYGATLLRLFVCLIGILSYALMGREHLHKPTVFVMMAIYMVYTVVETLAFSRTAKKV